MRARTAAHLKGNMWLWIGGLAVVAAVAAALRWGTIAAFLLMIVGILIMMKSQDVDPVAFLTEDVLHPEDNDVPEAALASGTAGHDLSSAHRSDPR